MSRRRPRASGFGNRPGWRRWAVSILAVAVLAGCGYSLRPSLPGGVKTVHIPVLVNRTQEPGVEDFITQALTEAVVTSGLVKIARSAAEADALLEGSIVEYAITALAFDRSSNVTQYRLQIALALTLRDRQKNEVIWKQERIADRADFPVSGVVTQTLNREDAALRRAAVEVARAIVSLAFQGF